MLIGPQAKMLSAEQFAQTYQQRFTATVAFLKSRGIVGDAAVEFAQTAWVRGWERRE